MKPEIKTKWLAALRSGEYQQGHTYLNGPDGYCCLGVLCDIYAKENNVKWADRPEDANVKHIFDGWTILPRPIRDWAGIKDDLVFTGIEKKNGATATLVDLNDSGVPFSHIADVIEYAL